jgi:transcriptional regulator with AAA-type ATPase domain
MIVPRSPEELLSLMRDLLRKNLDDIDNNLPVSLEWEIGKLKDLIISFYYYKNNKNIAKTSKEIGMSRTTLSYYINKNSHLTDAVTQSLDEDVRILLKINKKSPFF